MFYVLVIIFVSLFLANIVSQRILGIKRDNSITFVVGQIGAGKSAYSVKMARRALRRGRPVYSTDYIQGCNRFDISWLGDMKCPEDSLLIIDEAALKFNSRDYAKIQKNVLAYFKKCRHFRNDVILISQTFSDTDKQVRDLSTRVLFLRKIGWITIPVRVKGDVTIDKDGQPSMKYKIGKLGRPYIPALQGKYYDSWEDADNRPICPNEPWDDKVKVPILPMGEAPETTSETISDVVAPGDSPALFVECSDNGAASSPTSEIDWGSIFETIQRGQPPNWL